MKKPKKQAQEKSTNNAYFSKYMANKRAGERDIGPIPAVKNPKRRESCRLDLAKFLTTYKPESFSMPFSSDQLESIKVSQDILLNGGRDAEAAPRGDGKTTRIEGAVEWVICYGHRKYIVPIMNNRELAEEFLNSIRMDFETNEMLAEDFPEICYPIEKLEGIALRANAQTSNGKRTQMTWKGKRLVFPTVKGSAASGTIVQPRGILESMRGSKRGKMRPDLFILDDPQDDESANSPAQCDKRESIINKAVLGLAGPGQKIAGFMRGTVIVKGDLVDRILDRKRNPEWAGRRYKMIYKFPENMDLWKQYNSIRNEGLVNDDKGRAGNEFYTANRAEMDKGAIVAWEHRRNKDDISALQHAMNLLFRDKASFMSEYQNDPEEAKPSIYEIRPGIICSRLNHLKRFEVPDECRWLVLFADINYIGLNYVACAFKNDFTGFIVDYGKYPQGEREYLIDEVKMDTATGAQILSAGIINFVREVIYKQMPFRYGAKIIHPTRIIFDANYMTETVCAAVESLRRMRYPVWVDRARSVKQYRPGKKDTIIGQPGNNFHIQRGNHGEEIVHNADYWRMVAQKAFLLLPGQPGSVSLWGEDPREHEKFAYEVCAEKLVKYLPEENFYDWRTQPNQRNDKGDALTGACVGAAVSGAVITGGEKAWRPKKIKHETRKPKIAMEE
jgi:hypothetical protein